jgi:hypothetical protein
MSEQKAPYGGDIPAKVKELDNVQRAILDRVDRVHDRIDRLEVKMDAKFVDLENQMKTSFADLRESQRVLAQMLTELLARIPPRPDSGKIADQ